MPNTYVALATTTVSANAGPITFTSIPATYTDLVLVISGTQATSGTVRIQFNNDTASNYSRTDMYGDGSSAASYKESSQTYINFITLQTTQSNSISHIMNYANTTTYKTMLTRYNTPSTGVTAAGVTLWRKTPEAIHTITLTNTSNVTGTFSLYGIANAGTANAKATGGTIYNDNNYWYHIFTGSGAFVPNQALSCQYLVVAGGGGGGSNNTAGGGGGAGGYRSSITGELSGANSSAESALSLASGVSYSVTIGGGGAGATSNNGTNGTASSIIGTSVSISSTGGGGGGGGNGVTGGSGGGGSGQTAAGTTGAAGTSSQGLAGGDGLQTSVNYSAAGGGGASAAGSAGISQFGGAGGNGLTSFASGFPVVYAGGGGGGHTNDAAGPASAAGGAGGNGGGAVGGRGSNSFGQTGGVGTANTGGGGGGGATHTGVAVYSGGAGGSGIVIIRYAKQGD